MYNPWGHKELDTTERLSLLPFRNECKQKYLRVQEIEIKYNKSNKNVSFDM